MVTASVHGQESSSAAFGTVEDPGQIDTGFAHQPTAQFERYSCGGEQFGSAAQSFVKRPGQTIDVERLIAVEAGNIEPTTQVQFGQRSIDSARDFACAVH